MYTAHTCFVDLYVKGINLPMHEIYLAHMYIYHAKYTPLHLLQNGFVCKKNDATMFANKSNCTKATLIRQETKDLCFGKNARFYDRQEGCIETSMVE